MAPGPDGRLWVTLTGGQIAAVTSTGAVTHYAVPTANPGLIGITPGPGGLMWFSNQNAPIVGSITTGSAAPAPAPVLTPSVAPARTATKDGRTTITFTLRYAGSGNYAFRLETRAGTVLPMLAGSDIAGVRVKKTTTKAVTVRNAKRGKTVKVKVVMKGRPAKGTALRAIIAGPKGSRTTETIPV